MSIADNTESLRAVLAKVQALPEAGGGEPVLPVLQEKSVTPTKAAQSVTPDTGYDGLSKVDVGAIPDQYIIPSGTKSITANGTHNVREVENVNVNVPAPEIELQEKTVTPSKALQEVTADSAYDGLSKVKVNPIPAEYVVPTGTKTITANGTHDVAGYASASVNVPAPEIRTQTKTVTPATSAQTVTPDSGYDGLSQVTVNAMPTTTQATPSISVSSGGLITASATQSAGYVAAGTKSATQQLTVQAAQTITPGTADQTIASGRYLTGTQTIKGDGNLLAGNIKAGVSIFGVAGTFEGSGGGGGGSVETCTVRIRAGDYDVLQCDTIVYKGRDNWEALGWTNLSGGQFVTLENVAKGMPIVAVMYGAISELAYTITGNIDYVFTDGYAHVFLPNGDGDIIGARKI